MHTATLQSAPASGGGRTVVTCAPTRVDLGGGWTDVPPYSNECGGAVCNFAINRLATVTVRSRTAPSRPDTGNVVRSGNPETHDPLTTAAIRDAGMDPDEVQVSVANDFPVGAGLGGSSAAGVALAGALAAWRGALPPSVELARRSRQTEVNGLGIAGGWQDHYAAANGGAQLLEFASDDRVNASPLRLTEETARALERRCVIAYTGEARVSATTITGVMDAYRAGVPSVVRALSRMGMLAREMAGALTAGDLDGLAELVAEHWAYQRSLHPAIPTDAIDALLAAARGAGGLGGKALGASGGGCVLVMAADDSVDAVRQAVGARATLIPFGMDMNGFQVVSRG